jgi:hypothetical protein
MNPHWCFWQPFTRQFVQLSNSGGTEGVLTAMLGAYQPVIISEVSKYMMRLQRGPYDTLRSVVWAHRFHGKPSEVAFYAGMDETVQAPAGESKSNDFQ